MRKMNGTTANLRNGDCVYVMRNELEASSVDLILTDPPYDISFGNRRRKITASKVHGIKGIVNDKKNDALLSDAYAEFFRILKPGRHAYVFSRWDVVPKHMEILKKSGFVIKNVLIWVKNCWSMGDLDRDYAGQYENLIFAYKPDSGIVGKSRALNPIDGKKRHSNVLFFDRVAGKGLKHSHQKPVELLSFLISKSSEDGETVFDGFMGSGSTGVSAIRQGRNFIGCELDSGIFTLAESRISSETKIKCGSKLVGKDKKSIERLEKSQRKAIEASK